MATNNIVNDGLTHSWSTSVADSIQGGYGANAVGVTSDGDVHIVYFNTIHANSNMLYTTVNLGAVRLYPQHLLAHSIGTSIYKSTAMINSMLLIG